MMASQQTSAAFKLRSYTNGSAALSTPDLTDATDSTVSVSRSMGQTKVTAFVSTIPENVFILTMDGPYGAHSTFTNRAGQTTTSFGQYVGLGLCLANDLLVFTIKSYDGLGAVLCENQLFVQLTD